MSSWWRIYRFVKDINGEGYSLNIRMVKQPNQTEGTQAVLKSASYLTVLHCIAVHQPAIALSPSM
jgi:hypothetical protein